MVRNVLPACSNPTILLAMCVLIVLIKKKHLSLTLYSMKMFFVFLAKS